VLESISRFPPQCGYVVSSFLPGVLVDLRRRSQSTPLGIICETRKQLSTWPELPVEHVIAYERLITEALIADVHSAGNKVFGWTINKKTSMVSLANWGVDGIVSDKTELLVATFQAR
jgi:glycerophosphoryl diester phosphodiesterase